MPAPPDLLIPGPILALSALSLTARCILAHAAATPSPTATNSQLARRIGYPKHRIQRALAELEQAGYLHRSYSRPPVRRRRLAFTLLLA
jgi:DNA-binding MarR family transcriptional regulator